MFGAWVLLMVCTRYDATLMKSDEVDRDGCAESQLLASAADSGACTNRYIGTCDLSFTGIAPVET